MSEILQPSDSAEVLGIYDPMRWTESNLLSLIENQIPESLSLDYKDARALGKSDSQKREMSKDASSFANSAGGWIIYGIAEDGRIPKALDGVNPSVFSREWIEDVITSTIQPRISGLRINQISLSGTQQGKVAYVVCVPQATERAPHQAINHVYYKRHEFKSQPMEDYEVKDVARRAETPDLFCAFHLPDDESFTVSAISGGDTSEVFDLRISVGNRAIEPAQHVVTHILLDKNVNVVSSSDLKRSRIIQRSVSTDSISYPMDQYQFNWSPPEKMPIFNGVDFDLLSSPLQISLRNIQLRESEYLLIGAMNAPRMEPRADIWKLVVTDGIAVISQVYSGHPWPLPKSR